MDTEVRSLVEAWHWMYFEVDLVFEGVRPENLHRRPGPDLLSISEHCAHLVRSEASIVERYLFGRPPEEWADTLMRRAVFGWPPTMLESPVEADLARLTLAEVKDGLIREHERCLRAAQSLTLPAEHRFDDDWARCTTVADRLRIAAYHVAYHMGQICSARHMLGEETPEN